MAKSKLKWIVEFAVDESWVADGFNLTKERAMDMLRDTLSQAYESELGARILSRPTDAKIAKLQGFKSVADFRQAG